MTGINAAECRTLNFPTQAGAVSYCGWKGEPGHISLAPKLTWAGETQGAKSLPSRRVPQRGPLAHQFLQCSNFQLHGSSPSPSIPHLSQGRLDRRGTLLAVVVVAVVVALVVALAVAVAENGRTTWLEQHPQLQGTHRAVNEPPVARRPII